MGVQVREKKKDSGIYWIFIADQGRRRSLKAGPREVAEEVAKRLKIKFADDPDSLFKEKEAPKPTFKKLSQQWLEEISTYAKPSTVNRYTQVSESRVLPFVGFKRVDQVKKADIVNAINAAQKDGLSNSSLELVRTCFSGPLDIAALHEMIPTNLANGILKQMKICRTNKKDNKNGKTNGLKFLTPEQINLFLDTCKKYRPEYHCFYTFLFMTGTRLGEALAVTWSDIDWEDKVVNINKAFRLELGTTKTGGEREIDMPDELVVELHRLHVQRKKEALKSGEKVIDIAFHHNGQHMRQNQARRVFKSLLKKSELPDHRLHDTRHSYASLMLANGTNLDYVKRMLGHSDIAMTSNAYGHLMPNRDREQVNLLSQKILNG